jgi:hypothetical protein
MMGGLFNDKQGSEQRSMLFCYIVAMRGDIILLIHWLSFVNMVRYDAMAMSGSLVILMGLLGNGWKRGVKRE